MESSERRSDASPRLLYAVVALILASIVYGSAGKLHKLWQHGPHKLSAAVAAPAIGSLDELVESGGGQRIAVSGWALSRDGVAHVELVVNGDLRLPLKARVPRPDVARVHPDFPESAIAGFEGKFDSSAWPSGFKSLEIVVSDRQGGTTVLARRTLPTSASAGAWSGLPRTRAFSLDDVFYFVMATSNLAAGGAAELDTVFRPYESDTVKVGIRVPVLYLRTTKGKAGDYAFDPDFSASRKCGARTIAEDNLHGIIDFAVRNRWPVLFTLNGGIWADAACDVPEWDVNDVLEQDVANCQWNEKDQVMADDALKNLSGSVESPELGRALTFNLYAEKNRRYKKRNLQQAATIIRKFAQQHPDLFIGINLDPDLYLNPFFEGKQWYDYNPNTLRQFREWLRGSGPYTGQSGTVDLSRFRREKPLTLADVNALSGRQFARWEDVDPPRSFPVRGKPFWEDAWVREWEHFRRHLVDLHYDELSQWVAEAGIESKRIYSSQGFMAPGPQISPFPVRIDSPAKNYDTGGMSVEGSVPASGHLGAILYGASAVNGIRMEGEQPLFSVFRKLDPEWAVVEFNTADLRDPGRMADFSEAYRSLREIHNHGARFVSPMAWNGSRGTLAGQPGFVSYMALRDTPLEDAIKGFMISHANLPRRSRLWTFGAGAHADDDGWVAAAGTTANPGRGKLALLAGPDGKGGLESPLDLAFRPADYRAIILRATSGEDMKSFGVDGQTADGSWVPIVAPTEVAKLARVSAGIALPIEAASGDREFARIRLIWRTAVAGQPLILKGVAFDVR